MPLYSFRVLRLKFNLNLDKKSNFWKLEKIWKFLKTGYFFKKHSKLEKSKKIYFFPDIFEVRINIFEFRINLKICQN